MRRYRQLVRANALSQVGKQSGGGGWTRAADGSITLPAVLDAFNQGGVTYFAKYDTNGTVQWASYGKIIGGNVYIMPEAIYANSSNDMLVEFMYTWRTGAKVTLYNADGSAYATNPGGDYDYALMHYVVQIDSTGTTKNLFKILAGGNLGGRMTIDSSGNPIVLTNPSIFEIQKYNSSFVSQWTDSMGISSTMPVGLVTDTSRNVILLGQANSGSVTITKSGTVITPLGASVNAIIVKYNSAGTYQWYAHINQTTTGGYTYPGGIAIDSSNNLFVSCVATGTAPVLYNAGGTTFTTTLPNSPTASVLVKYSSAGAVQWYAYTTYRVVMTANSVTVDSSGNIILLSTFQSGSNVILYSSDGSQFSNTYTPVSGCPQTLITKYNSAGIIQWATVYTGYVASSLSSGETYSATIKTNSTNDIFAIGGINGNAGDGNIYNANGSLAKTIPVPNNGSNIRFLVKYNSGGTFQWVSTSTPITGSVGKQIIHIDASGNPLLTGSWIGGPGQTNTSLTFSNAM